MNEKLKKGFKFALIATLLAVSTVILAGWSAPRDDNGVVANSLAFVGATAYTVVNSTQPVLVVDGPCIVYGYAMDIQSTGSYVQFRDTDTANVSSAVEVANGYSQTAGANNLGFVPFPAPVEFTNGLSFNCSTNTCNATVFYRLK